MVSIGPGPIPGGSGSGSGATAGAGTGVLQGAGTPQPAKASQAVSGDMAAFLMVAQPATQGVPKYPLPHRDVPDKVSPLRGGATFEGRTMGNTLNLLHGMETYSEKHTLKMAEGQALAARSDYHGYSNTAAVHVSLPTLFFHIDDFGGGIRGALALHNMIDWLSFLTLPWSKLSKPPLMYVAIGRRTFYGYLEGLDPNIQEFMPNGPANGLPRIVTLNLSFLQEGLGLDALRERTAGLPKPGKIAGTDQVKGGAGGFVQASQLGTDPAYNRGGLTINGKSVASTIPGGAAVLGGQAGQVGGSFGNAVGSALKRTGLTLPHFP